MINQKLLVSGADFFADEFEINPYYTDNSIDVKKAMAEHAEIVDCFKKAGIEMLAFLIYRLQRSSITPGC